MAVFSIMFPSEYVSFKNMRQRCNYPKDVAYRHYGGRGIKVCERWKHFRNFLEDMGRKPTPDHEIERVDNDGDYCKENCKWTTRSDNCYNMRRRKRNGKPNTSKYRGVVYFKGRLRKPWHAQVIGKDGRMKSLGYFAEELDAAKAYDEAVKKKGKGIPNFK